MIFSLVLMSSSCCLADSSKNNEETVKQAKDLIKNGALVIDVRTLEEFNSGHLDGALHIPYDEIEERLSEIESKKDSPIVLYCKSGGRSGKATESLLKHGYTKAFNAGGYKDLK